MAGFFDILSRLPFIRSIDGMPDFGALSDLGEKDPGTEEESAKIEVRDDAARASELLRIDLREEAAQSAYRHNGKNKLKRYKRRKAGASRAIVVHQMGVEKSVDSKRYHNVTAHYVIRRDGAILKLFDHDVRLVCQNSLDRAPWHAIGIEMAGNFERVDGQGQWYKPEKFGHGRASAIQLFALGVLLSEICDEVDADGGRIEMIAPHIVSGRDSKGRPNRQLCPGSRVWQHAEAWALTDGRRVPREDEAFGGAPVPPEWRSAAWRERGGA